MGTSVGAVVQIDPSRETTSPAFYSVGVVGNANLKYKIFEAGITGLVGNACGVAANAGLRLPITGSKNYDVSLTAKGGVSGNIWLQPVQYKDKKVHDFELDCAGSVGVDAAFLGKKAVYDVSVGCQVGQKIVGNVRSIANANDTRDYDEIQSYRRNYATPYIEGGATFKIEDSNPRNGDHYLRLGAGLDFSNSKPTEVTDAGLPRAKDWTIDGTPNVFLKLTWHPAINRFGRRR